MKIDVLHAADVPLPEIYAHRRWRGRPRSFRAPCLSFLLHHPSAGPILVDTGLHPGAHGSLRNDFGLPLSVFFRGLRPRGEPFDAQLRAHGIEPGDVERVVMTHLHVDHTSGMRLLPNAEFVCDRREWVAAQGGGARKGYHPPHLPPAERTRLLDFAAEGERIDLLGDGSIRLVSTPGHSAGHLSVLVGNVLLAGDAAYTRRNIAEQVLPLLTDDAAAARRSLAVLARHTAGPVVPSHDPDAWRVLA